MKLIKSSLILFSLAIATSSYGTILWQNLGNTSAYNFSNSMDFVQGVSSPSYIGSLGSIEATCIYQGSGVRYHSEWTPVGTWNQGTNPTVYFGYALYLPTNFQFTGTQRAVTEQYGTRLAGGGTINPDWYQAWIGGGTPNAYQFSAINSSDETSGTMTVGAWHTIVTKVTFGSGGNVTVWFDGNQAWSQNGTINGGGSGDTNGLWALGLYEADWDGGNTGNGTNVTVYGAAATIATTYAEANPATYAAVPSFSGEYQIQCVASGLSLNVSGAATTNGAPIIQYSYSGTSNELWTFIATTNGCYQINSVNSGKDVVVQGASTTNGAKIIQWSFGSSGDDQWEPVPNSDGSYTFYNLNSGLVLDDPGSNTSSGTQFDQWQANGGANQEFNVTYISPQPSLTWNGNVNGNWNTSTANWQGGSIYQQGDLVTFNDTAAGTTNVSLTTALSPSSLTVSNNTLSYTFSGGGSINGPVGLFKTGTGAATFAQTGGDTFTGGITVNGGTLTYAAAGSFNGGVTNNAGTLILDQPGYCYGVTTNAVGATIQVGNNDTNGVLPSGALIDNGSLVFTQSVNASLTNVISGTGTLSQNDTNVLTLNSANNPLSGGVTINSGTLQVGGSGGNSGLGAGNTTVNAGGTLIGTNADAFGYAYGHNNPATIFINGGTVTDLGTSNYRITLPNITFTGGTLTSASGNNGDSSGNYCFFGNSTNSTVTTLSASTTAVISAKKISFHSVPTTFNVAAGNVIGGTYPGVDLVITSIITNFSGIDIRGFTKTGAGVMAVDGSNPLYSGAVTNSAGTLQLGAAGDTTALTEPLGTSPMLNSATLNFAGSKGITFSNVISGNGALVVSDGTNILTAANTYTGATTVSNGILAVNGSLASGSAVTVTAAGTLSGTGTVGGAVTVNGTIAPGSPSAIGTLTCSSTVTLNGTNIMKINKTTQTNDVLSVGGNLAYGGTLNLTNLSGTLTTNDAFKLFNAASFTGAFAQILPATPGANMLWNTNNLAVNGTLSMVSALKPTPHITGIILSGTNVIFNGTNGTAGEQYVLLSSTNVSLPVNQWTPVLTNAFDGGNFSVTNMINSNAPQNFYLLQIP